MDSINNLIKYLQDSRNGYRECAENVKHQSIKTLFLSFAKKREAMLAELKNVCEDEEAFQDNGTISGKIHQFFVNLKGFLTDQDTDSIIAEVRRGEGVLIDHYKQALQDNNGDEITTILKKQLREVESNVSEISKKSFAFS